MTLTPFPAASASRTAALLALTLALSGCAEAPQKPEFPTAAPTTPPLIATPPAPRPPTTAATTEPVRPTYRGPWEDPANPLYHRTIYFDYDSAEIKPEYLDLIRTHSAYLGATTAQRVTLDGNTDERGTREYNLALGDQRAESVRKLMLAEGVTPNQLTTLSFGEEKPADAGHGEGAWRLNRRVIIQY